MSGEDIAYFAPVLNKPESGVLSNFKTWKMLLKGYPQAKEFWDRHGESLGYNTPAFFKLLEENPRHVVQLFGPYLNASSSQIKIILSSATSYLGKKDSNYILSQHGFPAPILEALYSSRVLKDYCLFQLERNNPKKR